MTSYLSYFILFCQLPHRWGRPLNPTGQFTPSSPTSTVDHCTRCDAAPSMAHQHRAGGEFPHTYCMAGDLTGNRHLTMEWVSHVYQQTAVDIKIGQRQVKVAHKLIVFRLSLKTCNPKKTSCSVPKSVLVPGKDLSANNQMVLNSNTDA